MLIRKCFAEQTKQIDHCLTGDDGCMPFKTVIWIVIYTLKSFWGKSILASDVMTGYNEEHILEFGDESVSSSMLPELFAMDLSIYQEKHLPLFFKQMHSSTKCILALFFLMFLSF